MQKLIVRVHPFAVQQCIFIYDNEKADIPKVYTKTDNLVLTLSELVKEKNITRIDLAGPKNYTKGVKEQLEEMQFTLYNKNALEINII